MKRVELQGQLSLFDLDASTPKVINSNLDNPIFNLKQASTEMKKENLMSDSDILKK